MSRRNNQSWPRQLRPYEALIEMARAEKVFLASRKQPDVPAKLGPIRRLIELGLKAKK
jgi:hypothetical protein